MSTRRPTWYRRRQLNNATARETFLENYQGPPAGQAVQSRGASTSLFYRSLLQLSGAADPFIYRVSVLNSTLALVTATEAGLLTTLGASESALRLRGSGVKPSRLHWYQGDPTPQRVTSRWGTQYTRAYQANSHRSIPFSRATGLVEPSDLQTAFTGLFGPTGTKRSLLGAANGRAYLEYEKAPIAYDS